MNLFKKLCRTAAAGLCAFLILCVLSLCYFQRPMYLPSEFGNTDFRWPAGGRWLQMIEGISWGQFDQWGFNNPQVVENPEILVLGSSHMEATYVRQSQTMAQQLQGLLGDRGQVYNMGISGNHLPKSLQYLPATMEIFEQPPRLIIIEAQSLEMSDWAVGTILDRSIPSIYSPRPRWQEAILGLPYLRLLAKQQSLGIGDLLLPERSPGPAPEPEPALPMFPADAPEGSTYGPLFSEIQDLQQQYGTAFLVVYHPLESLQEDGSVRFLRDPYAEMFDYQARQYGIGFLDLTEDFEELYRQEHRLPHGFATGEIGFGHLNRDGHRVAAQAVYRWITEKEGT